MFQILEGASVIAAVILYLIPSIEADARGHKDAFAITMVNILLGWTVVGWFAARAWAHSRNEQRRLPRAAKRVLHTAGRVTTQNLMQHAKLRMALESRKAVAKRSAEVVYS
ncbi:superinfection immunity protein [Paraburkholderia sp. J7]|uniref:superinfection immunity protein n=1 Tax=Paraburkholderia sp. J7 TaxID=2805438 RepID=UPI002AB75FC3|nr:superinfection immunity protein [Paraburkholderia sp. J7]